mmetsp:Transcript_73604/g.172899  ORF Transcript_73604/g.172899 Transcript_73604/m.172899 type:complete len:130 (+) Transcript_73604:546-935(+)
MADPYNMPAMVFCAIGKDRTGLVSAMAAVLAGAPRDEIVADYMASLQGLQPVRHQVEAGMVAHGLDVDVFGRAEGEVMMHTLDYLETKWGGVAQYLLSHGLTQDELASVRRALTGPVDPTSTEADDSDE